MIAELNQRLETQLRNEARELDLATDLAALNDGCAVVVELARRAGRLTKP